MDDERTNTMAAMHLFLTNTVFVLSAYKRRRCHRYWVQEIYRKRQEYGAFYHMMLDLELDDINFKNYFRLNKRSTDDAFAMSLVAVLLCVAVACGLATCYDVMAVVQ